MSHPNKLFNEFSRLFDRESEADRLTQQSTPYKRMKHRAFDEFIGYVAEAHNCKFANKASISQHTQQQLAK